MIITVPGQSVAPLVQALAEHTTLGRQRLANRWRSAAEEIDGQSTADRNARAVLIALAGLADGVSEAISAVVLEEAERELEEPR